MNPNFRRLLTSLPTWPLALVLVAGIGAVAALTADGPSRNARGNPLVDANGERILQVSVVPKLRTNGLPETCRVPTARGAE
jgi:hypothetical protein